MNVDGVAYRSIWVNADGCSIDIIDQTRLPHAFVIQNLGTLQQACDAIRDMQVRGAPLIGATAAYGFYLAMRDDASIRGHGDMLTNCCLQPARPRSTCAGRWID